jgi:hypothetical protein
MGDVEVLLYEVNFSLKEYKKWKLKRLQQRIDNWRLNLYRYSGVDLKSLS